MGTEGKVVKRNSHIFDIINRGYYYLINLYQLTMATSELFKTTASTMKKVANLPRYRHPGDLINMDVRPIRQQRL